MTGPRLVQWSRFSDAFQRLFGLQGNTALNVVDDVFLTLPVEEDAAHLAFIRGWHRFACSGSQAAVAAQFQNVAFGLLSPILCVIDYVQLSAGNIRCRFGIRSQAVASVAIPLLDDREGAQSGTGYRLSFSPGVLGGSNAAAQLAGGGAFPLTPYAIPADSLVVNGSTPLIPVGAVLTQVGSCLMVETEAVNNAIQVTFYGRYRELTQQER